MPMLEMLRSLKKQPKSEDSSEPVFNIPPLPIRGIIDAERRNELLRLQSHLRGTQHATKKYDWDANIMGSIQVQGYVKMSDRRPCVSRRIGKKIVKRLTTMICGHERFPEIVVEGDEDAQDYARELAKVAKFRTKFVEARNKGGATGSIAISWAFSDGKPTISIHSSPLVEVLKWKNFEEREPASVMKAYDYSKRVLEDGVMKKKTFWFVRYWDENVEVTWKKIPDSAACEPSWVSWPHEIVEHGAGICPVVWIQNIPDSDEVDGISDFDGQADDFDEIDRLASAVERGTIANVDPTLVIKDRKGKDETIVRKGTGTVIYSPGGADYLELEGTAVKTGMELVDNLEDSELEEAEVVMLDPKELSGSGVSAAALKTRFLPMLAKCDLIRDQYGEAITKILKSMLEAARRMGDEQMVVLEPRVETKHEKNEDGESSKETVLVERTPGTSSNICLRWPPYFPADWKDKSDAVNTVKGASGRQVLSQKTAVEALAPLFDIEDAEEELERIEEDQEVATERAKTMFDAGGPIVQTQPVDEPKKDEKPEEE